MAVALRFEKAEAHPKLAGVRWTADLVFPVPASWVAITWNVRDPNRRVAGVGLGLRLKLDRPTRDTPTVVDLGASRTVYTTLSGNEQVELRAGLSGDASLPWKAAAPGGCNDFPAAPDSGPGKQRPDRAPAGLTPPGRWVT